MAFERIGLSLWVAAWIAGGACAPSGPSPELDAVQPVGGHVASAVDLALTGRGFVQAGTVDVGSGRIDVGGTNRVLLRNAVDEVELSDVEVGTEAQTIQATVPADIPGGVYDVVVVNPDGSSATLPGGYLAADVTGVRCADAAGPVTDVVLGMELINANGDPAAATLWSYQVDVSVDSGDVSLSTNTLTLDQSARSGSVTATSTVADTSTVTLTSASEPAAPVLPLTTAALTFEPGPATTALVPDQMTPGTSPLDVAIQITDDFGNLQGAHGGVSLTWYIEQSQHPQIDSKPAGPTATLVFADGTAEQTITLDPGGATGEVEVGFDPTTPPMKRCFGLVCFGGAGNCGFLVPTGCLPAQ